MKGSLQKCLAKCTLDFQKYIFDILNCFKLNTSSVKI